MICYIISKADVLNYVYLNKLALPLKPRAIIWKLRKMIVNYTILVKFNVCLVAVLPAAVRRPTQYEATAPRSQASSLQLGLANILVMRVLPCLSITWTNSSFSDISL